MSETSFSLVTPDVTEKVMQAVLANQAAVEHLTEYPCHSITFRHDNSVYFIVVKADAMPNTLTDEGVAHLVEIHDPVLLQIVTDTVDCGAGMGTLVSRFLMELEPTPVDFLEVIAGNMSAGLVGLLGRSAQRSRSPFGNSPFGSRESGSGMPPQLREALRDALRRALTGNGESGMLVIEIDATGRPRGGSPFSPFGPGFPFGNRSGDDMPDDLNSPFDAQPFGADEEFGDDTAHDAPAHNSGGSSGDDEE